MGNQLSQAEGNGLTSNHREDGEVSPATYQPNFTSTLRLRGGHVPELTGVDPRSSGWWIDSFTTGTGARNDQHHGLSANDGYDSDCYEIPDPASHQQRPSRRPYGQGHPATLAPPPAQRAFDFNDSAQPLPWNKREHDDEFQVRPFAHCNDTGLFAYLAERSISLDFLRELDLFLQGHPEIDSCAQGRHLLLQISTLPPLEAYKHFIKGYTKPARYIDGVIKTEYFQVPMGFTYCPLRKKYDQELIDFFIGFEYRHDIIDHIDQEVSMGIEELALSRPVPLALRKLICYAVWGNPVDAYKWFEYSYQQEYMPHRYLPEHVVLGHVPKPRDYAEPQPSCITGWKKYGKVRHHMARAKDQGVDVLDVLITEYRMALVRKGHSRSETDKLCASAKGFLDTERQYPTGVDIVDMIMDEASGCQRPSRRAAPRSKQFSFSGSKHFKMRGSKHRVTNRAPPGFLQIQGIELRDAKTTLLRLYTQEHNAFRMGSTSADLPSIRASRGTAERRYVNCLIRYLRDTKRMSSGEAAELQHNFTRARMSAMVSNKDFLLKMYPHELNY